MTRASGEPETLIYQTSWKKWTPKSASTILYRLLVANWPCSIDLRVCAVRWHVSEELTLFMGRGLVEDWELYDLLIMIPGQRLER